MKKNALEYKLQNIIKVSDLFYKFIDYYKKQDISIREESLIDNLLDYKKSNYTHTLKRFEAAKKISEVNKAFDEKVRLEEQID